MASIDDLNSDDYIRPDGSLLLILSIRPLSYWQAKRDYDIEIERKKAKIQKLSDKINED